MVHMSNSSNNYMVSVNKYLNSPTFLQDDEMFQVHLIRGYLCKMLSDN